MRTLTSQSKAFWADITSALTENSILDSETAAARYGANTLAAHRKIAGAVQPATAENVTEVVRIAARHKVPLWPISTGNNWGYGSALPAQDGCVIVDLSTMADIIDFDATLGTVTIQPGVTQKQLADFLKANGNSYLTPCTGAGPSCSVLANALERGYGLTPYTDHFGAVTRLEAVLADGSLYQTPMTQQGAARLDGAYKWGVGPYYDGLFSQAGHGIVTSMAIALAPRPAATRLLLFKLNNEDELEQDIPLLQQALRTFPGTLGGVNLMNRERVTAMLTDPSAHASITAWTGVGTLFGSPKVLAAAEKELKHLLRGRVHSLRTFDQRKLRFAHRLLGMLPGRAAGGLRSQVATLQTTLSMLEGTPGEVALPLAYLRRKDGISGCNHPLNPDRDDCGLLWFAPIVPMDGHVAREVDETIRTTCEEFSFSPMLTMTAISDRYFECTVPIVFDKTSNTEQAHACYNALFDRCRALGAVPYRLHVNAMHRMASTGGYQTLHRAIKAALDPDGILMPGRYE